ncbi:ABC transporter permease [Horticoccus luteus]|uniref:ABC transporter permease n=1 Tax=Horticoccus luteus TaxID=2862869 RepID=A0A8F9XMT8_9BACT|nr:ABC transporter permease subunit [Horticoccus luteus]QYM80636.1 ABC transporter permease [Horticoccus luteus]
MSTPTKTAEVMATRAAARRVWLIADATWRDARRQRLFQLGVLLGAALVIAGRLFREVNFGETELRFLTDVGLGAVTFFGALLAIALPAQSFFAELEQRALQAVLARPVSRTEFIAGKLLGVVTVLGVFCGLLMALIVALVWARAVELDRAGVAVAVPWKELCAGGALAWLRLSVVAAMTMLVCTVARTALLAMSVSLGWLVACQLLPVAQAVYVRGEPTWGTWALRGVGLVLPNLGALDWTGGANAAWVTLYGASYLVVFAALAAASFRSRDL